jgi:hypothetical protein
MAVNYFILIPGTSRDVTGQIRGGFGAQIGGSSAHVNFFGISCRANCDKNSKKLLATGTAYFAISSKVVSPQIFS